jgi:hypothetical protein
MDSSVIPSDDDEADEEEEDEERGGGAGVVETPAEAVHAEAASAACFDVDNFSASSIYIV